MAERDPAEREVFEGSDPIDLSTLPFQVARGVAERFATVEADRWGAWFAGSEVVSTDALAAGGTAALDALWSGVLTAIDDGWFGSCTWAELAAAGPVPLWCRLRPGYEEHLGAVGCWVTAGLIALTGRWIEREWHGRWVLPPDGPGTERAEPVIAIPGGRGLVPQVQLVSIVGRANGLTGAPEREPHRLRELVLVHSPGSGSPGADAAGEDEPEGPALEPADGTGFRFVSFSDTQGHEEDERIDRLVERLNTTPGIGAAHREDREVVLVRSELGDADLQALLDAAWRDLDR